MHFSPSFFHWAKPMPSRIRSLGFSNPQMRPSPRHGNVCRIICLHAPHHGMEEWFIIQSFYHGLIRSAREHIDATAGGSFFTLSTEEAHKLVEQMASNQSWDEECALRPAPTRFTSLKRWTCSMPRLIFI
jgi:hypothetical protein